jgi:hypothetical protein
MEQAMKQGRLTLVDPQGNIVEEVWLGLAPRKGKGKRSIYES